MREAEETDPSIDKKSQNFGTKISADKKDKKNERERVRRIYIRT